MRQVAPHTGLESEPADMTAPALAALSAFGLRAGRPRDEALVYASWIASDRFSRAGYANRRVYEDEQRRTIRELLARDGTTLLIAHDPEDDDAIIGWALVEPNVSPPVVHYVYVKKAIRGTGVARALLVRYGLPSVPCHFTHQPVIHQKEKRLPKGWVYNQARAYR